MDISRLFSFQHVSKGIAFSLLGLFACSGESEIESHFSEIELQSGDLVFRKGKSTKSKAVLFADKSGYYSHVGIVAPTDSGIKIIHIEPDELEKDRIKVEGIKDFFHTKNAEAGAVMRFCDSVLWGEKAAEYAIKLSANKQIKFDHDYDLEDTTKMYCTELIWRAYNYAGYDITNKRRNKIDNFPSFSGTYIFPSDISKNSKLIIIYKF